MNRSDAIEFLDTNKVEEGIQNALNAGAVIFSVAADVKAFRDGCGTLRENSGCLIYSTNRDRNIGLLMQLPSEYQPLGIARYIAGSKQLEIRPRERFHDDPVLVDFLNEMSKSSLVEDPDLAAIVSDYSKGLTAS